MRNIRSKIGGRQIRVGVAGGSIRGELGHAHAGLVGEAVLRSVIGKGDMGIGVGWDARRLLPA